MSQFRIDDKVRAYGLEGLVTDIFRDDGGRLNVEVFFSDGTVDWFLEDGRVHDWHRAPSLSLIARRREPPPEIQSTYLNTTHGGRFVGFSHDRFDFYGVSSIKLIDSRPVEALLKALVDDVGCRQVVTEHGAKRTELWDRFEEVKALLKEGT